MEGDLRFRQNEYMYVKTNIVFLSLGHKLVFKCTIQKNYKVKLTKDIHTYVHFYKEILGWTLEKSLRLNL